MQDTSEVLAVMAALEAAIAATLLSYAEEDKYIPEVNRALSEIDPSKWSRRIQSSVDNPHQLEAIRKEFDDLTLSFISALLAYRQAKGQVLSSYDQLDEQIRALVRLVDAPATSWLPFNLRSAMRELVVRAIDTHHSQRPEVKISPAEDLGDGSSGYEILLSAYRTLAADLVYLGKQVPNYQYYRFSGTVRPYRAGDISQHGSQRVPFVDCLKSIHPANLRLEEAHIALELSFKLIRDCGWRMSRLELTRIDERQYGAYLISILHYGGELGGAKMQTTLDEQNKRRVAYESARVRTLLAADDLKVRYDELFRALIAAGEETTALLGEIEADPYNATVDRRLTIRIAMNNCLAADRCLRTVSRTIDDAKRQAEDLSLGTGNAALIEVYEKKAKQYRTNRSKRSYLS